MLDTSKHWLTVGEAATYLSVSADTLRRWDDDGTLRAFRSPKNYRLYTQEMLDTRLPI